MYKIVLMAALGYFVDIYDLILYNIVRVDSLTDLGLTGDQIFHHGIFIFNMQMTGMLIGGLIWGILGDKRGRLSVLLGSILLYSISNFLNGFVTDVHQYAILRFIAGLGLAGELGAGITLIVETMPKDLRGYGTTIVSAVGILGAVMAYMMGDWVNWRLAYIIGGLMGFALLLLRFKAHESGLFAHMKEQHIERGSLKILLKSPHQFGKYIACILIGIPLWYVVGILITFVPEFAPGFGMFFKPDVAQAVLWAYIGLSVGSLLSGVLSQWFKTRKKIILLFMLINALLIFRFLTLKLPSLFELNFLCFLLGIGSGYWTLFVTMAAEQFGTNIRATVATTVPNFVRGSVVPLTLSFGYFKTQFGIITSAAILGGVCVLLALIALFCLQDTHDKDMNYLE